MRGLEEIKQINEDPSAHYASREPQHFGPGSQIKDHGTPDLKSILEQIKGGNAKPAADETAKLIETLLGSKRQPVETQASEDTIVGLFAAAAILDLLGGPTPTLSIPRTLADRPRRPRHLGMDGILSAIDAEPPFLKFWQKLNDDLASKGLAEAGYKQAKEAFLGGATPAGTLTFIGKEWDGLRAVPSHAVQGRKSYHGEFRQVTDEGTVWRTVASQAGLIEYATPEAALHGARHARIHSEAIAKSWARAGRIAVGFAARLLPSRHPAGRLVCLMSFAPSKGVVSAETSARDSVRKRVTRY